MTTPLERTGRQPLAPGATIGILGGGQLGRMLGFAARAMGYRIVVLDPDPDCPAAAIADRVVAAAYDSVAGAVELARGADVVTYELEHVDAALVDAVEAVGVPVRPGARALRMTQDRLAERRFVGGLGIATAPWREVADAAGLRAAAAELGTPLRLKAPLGGYDGRSQVADRLARGRPGGDRAARPAARHPAPRRARAGLSRPSSPSSPRGRSTARSPRSRSPATATTPGSSSSRWRRRPCPRRWPSPPGPLGARVAEALDAVGVVTAELFLLRDGTLALNELAPRVHNSGHWTIEGARTSQFEQHVRAICGLPLGDPAALGPDGDGQPPRRRRAPGGAP